MKKIKYKNKYYNLKKYDPTKISQGKKLFYIKNNSIDYVEIVKIYPGYPAPPDSYTLKIIYSKIKDRINREINVLHNCDKLFEII